MYLIDYIPDGEISGNGHYRLQDEWLKEVLESQDYISQTITLKNFFSVLMKVWLHNIPIFMPNCSLYDRFSILDTILLMAAPFQRKIVIVHTVSKINFLNKIFCRIVRNCQIHVYSDTLRSYLRNFGLSASNEIKLAEYPNANMIYKLRPASVIPGGLDLRGQRSLAVAWGNAARKIDKQMLVKFLEVSSISRVVIVGSNSPFLASIAQRYPLVVEVRESATDFELAELLFQANINLMFFSEQYDFYKSKRAASGVYLTALRFGVPSLISGEFGSLKTEILSDGSSKLVTPKTVLQGVVDTSDLEPIITDPFIRDSVNLNFLKS